MKKLFKITACTVFLLAASVSARAESLAFTVGNGVNLPAGNLIGAAVGSNACADQGTCASALLFTTTAGGRLTVTASDGGSGDAGAFAVQRDRVNSGLGVAAGSTRSHGSFQMSDSNLALDERSETLTLSFEKAVQISALYFFADDAALTWSAKELDRLDGFTVSIDGGAAQEYSFGSLGGAPVTFGMPLVGRSFTFGYASKLSGEDYYLGGMTMAAAAVPESGGLALMALGMAGIILAARRRQGRDPS
jgi:hypothetical protein